VSKEKLAIAPLQGAQLVMATVGVSLSTFMQVLDTTIANVSVPTIAGSMGISSTQGTWIITSFGVSTAISMPLTGRMTERFGQVRLFMFASALFVLASFLCGIAPTMQTLIGARVLQGVFAGPLMPLSQALMLAIYPPKQRGQALSLWATIAVVAPIVGPILGGYISDNASWPWIFFINIPVGIVAVGLTWLSMHKMESPRRKPPVDWTGLVLLSIWVGALQVMLDLGTDENWFDSNLIITLALVAGVAFVYFLVWELSDEHPIVDLSLFKSRNFVVGTFSIGLVYAAFFGSGVLLPLVLQTQLGYTATWAGLVLAPVGVAPILLSRTMGRYMHRIEPRVVGTLGFLVIAFVMWMRAAFSTDSTFWVLALPQAVLGTGLVLMFTPLTGLMLSQLPPSQSANALALSTFTRFSLASFGASLFTNFWQRREAVHHTRLAEVVTNYDPVRSHILQMLTGQGMSQQQTYGLVDATLSRQTFMMAADDVFWISGWVIVALIAIIWLAKPPFHAGSGHGPAAGKGPAADTSPAHVVE
jgi:DHA2 family multidrug resistance protein